MPSAVFLQAGTARQTHEVSAGADWNWGWNRTLGRGIVSGYFEAALSGWNYPNLQERETTWLGQVGAIPVLRYRPGGQGSPWFVEAGVGLTFTTTVYDTQSKRFSTRFNVGDHVALGTNFGDDRQHELALRVEHYSNAGIKEPNPGLDFVEIRYAYRFR